MAQPSQVVPTVTLNVSGTKQQINLRDYLNVRVAPFLKKAIHDSLETEAQYPLQWLGEHLIQQSILHEGNPDATNIRERFVYNHDTALPKQPTPPDTTRQLEEPVSQQPATEVQSAVNGTTMAPSPQPQDADPTTLATATAADLVPQDTPLRDTEMGGTS